MLKAKKKNLFVNITSDDLHRNPFWKFTLFLLFVQLEKFYSDLSQPVASDIDFEYLRMMIMMMMTMMLMMMLMMMTMMMIVKK